MCTTGEPYEDKYCVSGEECTTVEGCRLCSDTGHCYVCLPGFEGAPNCLFADNLPANLFIFFILAFVPVTIGMIAYSCKRNGTRGYLGIHYYMLAVIEFFSAVFLVARLQELVFAMFACSFILLRIIISIVAYENYYLKYIDDGRALIH